MTREQTSAIKDGHDRFHASSDYGSQVNVHTHLGSNTLQDVRSASMASQAALPASFGNFQLDYSGGRHEAAVTMASTENAPVEPGHIRVQFPKGWKPEKGAPGHDCGPVTIYPNNKNGKGGFEVDVKPGKNGCTLPY